VSEDTHLTRLGRNVDLDDVMGLVDGLGEAITCQLNWPSIGRGACALAHVACDKGSGASIRSRCASYLMRERQAELDLLTRLAPPAARAGDTLACLVVDGLGVASPLHGNAKSCRASSESRAGNAEGVHDELWSRLRVGRRQRHVVLVT
jgi:hypothetical protein